jgi:hypothetical protein
MGGHRGVQGASPGRFCGHSCILIERFQGGTGGTDPMHRTATFLSAGVTSKRRWPYQLPRCLSKHNLPSARWNSWEVYRDRGPIEPLVQLVLCWSAGAGHWGRLVGNASLGPASWGRVQPAHQAQSLFY